MPKKTTYADIMAELLKPPPDPNKDKVIVIGVEPVKIDKI
jgi:hypothetical protein